MDEQEPGKPRPKSMAARAKTYREKKKEEMGEEAYRQWERESKRNKRQKIKMDPIKYEKALQKDRERKARKKSADTEVPSCDTPSTSGFPNKQSLSKSVNKVKVALPKSTPKKLAVLSNVVQTLTPTSKKKLFVNSTGPNPRGRPPFSEEQKAWLIDFLKRGNISYTCPGRRDTSYMGKDGNGNRVYHANHYLLWYIRELVPLMNEDIKKSLPLDDHFSVSYGSLVRLIKPIKYIRFRDKIPENTCMCEYCENLELLLAAVKLSYPDVPSDPHTFMKQVVCDQLATKCADGECISCGNDNEFYIQVNDSVKSMEEISFYKWESGGASKFPKKDLKTLSGDNAASELDKQVRCMKRHVYNNIRQHSELDMLKKTLPINSVIMQVDFSENYDNKQKNEIQSAYFGHQSFSLYTAVIWYVFGSEVKAKSFCFISDMTSHDKFMVLHYNKLLIEFAEELVPHLDTVHFWSDGCASQFKSRFCFHLLATSYPLNIKLTWSFFESHHGKGPVDGIGGRVKCSVYSDVKAGLVVLPSAKEFADHANKRVKTKVVFVSEYDILSMSPEIPSDAPQIHGTQRVRFVDRSVDLDSHEAILHFYRNSQFNSKWEDQDQSFHDQAYKLCNESGTSPPCTSDKESGSEQGNMAEEMEYSEGDWVIVEYDTKLYPGEVLEVRGCNTYVRVMHKSGSYWKWPEETDMLWYNSNKVKGKIQPPVPVGSRLQYKFLDKLY